MKRCKYPTTASKIINLKCINIMVSNRASANGNAIRQNNTAKIVFLLKNMCSLTLFHLKMLILHPERKVAARDPSTLTDEMQTFSGLRANVRL